MTYLIAGAFVIVLGAVLIFTLRPLGNTTQKSPTSSPSNQVQPTTSLLTTREVTALLGEKRGDTSFAILDVRTPEEYTSGHLAGSENIDYYAADIKEKLAELDRSKTYLVYCRTGKRSSAVATMMESLGFTQINDLQGGIEAWKAASLPIE